MIKANGGTVEFEGRLDEILIEFSCIVKAFHDNNLKGVQKEDIKAIIDANLTDNPIEAAFRTSAILGRIMDKMLESKDAKETDSSKETIQSQKSDSDPIEEKLKKFTELFSALEELKSSLRKEE